MTPPFRSQARPAEAKRPAETLDTGDGLERIMGDHALYARMLARFRSDYGAGVTPLRAALDAGDIELAHRLAHTLKGAAGMIGARAVHDQASLLETALRTDSGASEAALDDLTQLFAELLAKIDAMQLASADPAEPVSGSLDLLDDQARLAQFVQLLREGDGAAIDVLEHSAATLMAVLGEERYAAVAAAAQEFDFEGALAALETKGG